MQFLRFTIFLWEFILEICSNLSNYRFLADRHAAGFFKFLPILKSFCFGLFHVPAPEARR